MEYKGYEIEINSFGFVVTFCGDEIVFSTLKEAEEFIDEISE